MPLLSYHAIAGRMRSMADGGLLFPSGIALSIEEARCRAICHDEASHVFLDLHPVSRFAYVDCF